MDRTLALTLVRRTSVSLFTSYNAKCPETPPRPETPALTLNICNVTVTMDTVVVQVTWMVNHTVDLRMLITTEYIKYQLPNLQIPVCLQVCIGICRLGN